MIKKMRISKYKKYFALYGVFILYSFSTVFSKLASGQEFLSMDFIVLYGIMIFILGIYAILWQQVLKRFDLGVAYANKAVVIVLGLLWGKLFFDEAISLNKIVGALIIIIGVYLVVKTDE